MQDLNSAEGLPQAPANEIPQEFSDTAPMSPQTEIPSELQPEAGGTEEGTRKYASGRFEAPEALEKAYETLETDMTHRAQENAALKEELRGLREEIMMSRQSQQPQQLPVDLEQVYNENGPVQAMRYAALQAVYPIAQVLSQMQRQNAAQQYRTLLPDIDKEAARLAQENPGLLNPELYYAAAAGKNMQKLLAQAKAQGMQEARATYTRARQEQQVAPDVGAPVGGKPSDLPDNIDEYVDMNTTVFSQFTREDIEDEIRKRGL